MNAVFPLHARHWFSVVVAHVAMAFLLSSCNSELAKLTSLNGRLNQVTFEPSNVPSEARGLVVWGVSSSGHTFAKVGTTDDEFSHKVNLGRWTYYVGSPLTVKTLIRNGQAAYDLTTEDLVTADWRAMLGDPTLRPRFGLAQMTGIWITSFSP